MPRLPNLRAAELPHFCCCVNSRLVIFLFALRNLNCGQSSVKSLLPLLLPPPPPHLLSLPRQEDPQLLPLPLVSLVLNPLTDVTAALDAAQQVLVLFN
eukprot:324964-Hanusia_phi.AAC.1